MRTDQSAFLNPSHPFYDRGRAAEAEFFLARDASGHVVGRVAAILNHLHNRHQRRKDPAAPVEGFFGFFEAIDDQAVARSLLDAAAAWLRQRGCNVMLGPTSPSHNYEYGLLVDGFAEPHRLLLAHNPPYYPSLLENWGLTKARDLYAFTFDLQDPALLEFSRAEAERFMALWEKRYGSITVRSINMRDFENEIRLAVELVNRSLEQNWGYSPVAEGEVKQMAQTLRYVAFPDLVMFGEHNGKPVGVVLALPDLNEVIRRIRLRFGPLELVELLVRSRVHRFSAGRVVALGVARDFPVMGVGPAFFLELFRRFPRRRLRYLDASWVLEDNEALLRMLRRFKGVPDRTYRIYQKHLAE